MWLVRGAASRVVQGMHVHVEWAPVQEAVGPVEPGVVQVVQGHHREQHVEHLHRWRERGGMFVSMNVYVCM